MSDQSEAVEMPGVERVPMTRLRRRIGDNMVKSLATSPHVTLSVDVDYHVIAQMRERDNGRFRAEHGFSLTYLPFVARVVSELLAEYPDMNSSIDGTDLLRHANANLGIAVDLDGGGLIVPVVRNVQTLTLTDIAERIHDLQVAAGEGGLKPEDVQGGTFTITSPGRRGADRTTPIINQPQVAILAIDAIRPRPVVHNGEIVIHPVGALSLSFDHRPMDGVYATGFLTDLRERIESESRGPFFDRAGTDPHTDSKTNSNTVPATKEHA